MTPDRWQQVERLYHSALEREGEERAMFLQQACAGDDALRQEVESLLAQESGGEGLLDRSALGALAADMFGQQVGRSLVGGQLGSYRVDGLLGRGGMGEVYRAHDPKLKRDVAIKVLPSLLSGDPDRLRRFEQEARAAAALNHPNILAVFQMGTYEGAPYLVSELLQGATLREHLKRGPIPLRKVIDYGVQIARGLAAAHGKGIVHRDLKPENLFVTKEGGVKILDFGLAKLTRPTEQVDINAPTVSALTEPGAVLGTVGYMSPEQVSGKPADHRADIFAFGAILYEMLTGKRAFQKPTAAETMSAILNEDPRRVAQLAPTTPAAIQRVVRRCLEKSPEQRFQSALDLAFALEALSDSGGAPKLAPGKQIKAIDSLAVLPLENASGDPEADYLSDGISETLINSLAQLRKIRVVPRTLAFQYRVAGVESLRAGRELGVSAVLAGRMVQHGEDLIVSVELVDVDRQAQLWGGRYNRKMKELVALQEELTAEISEKLRLQLTGEERKRLRKRPTENNEAFRLVLQARHFMARLSPDGLRKAVELCKRAAEIDSTYGAAFAHLSSAYGWLGFFGYASRAEIHAPMMAAARKAVLLDDKLAEAHAGLGLALLRYEWDFKGAEHEARRSLELNSDSALGLFLLETLRMGQGRFDEAIAVGKRAVDLHPVDELTSWCLAVTYFHAGRFENAIEQFRKTLEIDPSNPAAHGFLSVAYSWLGQREKAIAECEESSRLTPTLAFAGWNWVEAYAPHGETREARRVLEEAERKWKPDGASAFFIAASHATLGDKDMAFEWLEKAFQERAPLLCTFKINLAFRGLRGDPRFDALVKRIGVPD